MKWLLIILICAGTAFSQELDSNWVDIFDGKTFEGWYSFISGTTYDNPADDPTEHFEIIDSAFVYNAVSGTQAGFISTDSAYGRYHFRVEYKLGDKCILSSYCKNSGLMYCMIVDGIWGTGIESNMYFDWPTAFAPLGGVQVDEQRPNFGNFSSGADVMNDYTTDGEWNLMEVIVWGADSSKQYINGYLGGWGIGIKKPNGDPLTEGRIALQLEGNDVSFRRMQIRDLDGPVDVLGCTDSTASNYNPDATKDDSSCIAVSALPLKAAEIQAFSTGSTLVINQPGYYRVNVRKLNGETAFAVHGLEARVIEFKERLPAGLYLWQVTTLHSSASGKLLLD